MTLIERGTASGPGGLDDAYTVLPGAEPCVTDFYIRGLLNELDGIMYVRRVADHRFLLANAAFERLVGVPAEQIVGHTSHELFPAEVADQHVANDERVRASERALHLPRGRSGPVRTRAKLPLVQGRRCATPKAPCSRSAASRMDVTDDEAERRSTPGGPAGLRNPVPRRLRPRAGGPDLLRRRRAS